MTRNVEEIFGGVVTAPHQIPYTYTSVNGGETFLSLPFYPVTGLVTINGGVQVPLDNFVIDKNTLNLGRELDPNDVVFCLFDKVMSPQDTTPSMKIYKFFTNGGETEFTPDFTAYGVQTLFVDGKYQVPGTDYNYNYQTGKVTMTNPLPASVWVVAEMMIKESVTGYSGPDGAGKIGSLDGLSVQEHLTLGRIVFPEMYGVGVSSPTDDELFSSMFAALEAKDDTLLGTSLPYTVDLRGKVYTLLESHQVDVNINIINGHLLMNGGQIVISNELAGSRTRRIILKDLKVRYIGTTYFPDALIKVPRCYNSFVISCDFWAGDTTSVITDSASPYFGKPLRARYGLWLGSRRAWGCGIIGGEYFGGETPCRIGYTNDHTGISVTGGSTFHHGWVGNLLLCNPAGFLLAGINIEHSENGAWGLCITSGTNADAGSTVINPAHGGKIEGVYFYNNANGTTGTTNATAGVLIGYDAPGTMGWDNDGYLITSQNTAHSITIENCYIVSPKQDYAVKLRGLAALEVLKNKYTYATGSYGFLFEGTCARSRCQDNRNQSTGAFDEVEYKSTNKPAVGGGSGTFLPTLVGATTAGSLTYSTRGGDYSITNGRCHLSLWLTVSAIGTQPAGALTITLPVAITAGRRSGAGVDHVNVLGNQTYNISTTDNVTVNVTGALDSDATATLTATGTGAGTGSGNLNIPNSKLPMTALILNGTTLNLRLGGVNMDGSTIGVNTALELSISYPVDGAIFTG